MRRAAAGLLLLTSTSLGSAALGGPSLHAQRSRIQRSTQGDVRLEVVARIHTGVLPKSVEVSPDGRHVWVNHFGRIDGDNVAVYDAETLERVGTVEFEGNAVETAFSPDGRTAYVSNFRRHVVEVIDATTYEVTNEVRVGNNPKVLLVSPDGGRLYVANWSSNDVTVLDTSSLERVRRLRTGAHPRGMVLNDAGQLLVAAMYDHRVHVFGQAERREERGFTPCQYPRHLALSPDEQTLYASCSCCRQVRRIDPTTGRVQALALTGRNPRTLAITDDGRHLAVAGFDDSTVTLIDTEAWTHRVTEVPGANRIVGVAVRGTGENLRVYATSWLTGELIVMSPRSE